MAERAETVAKTTPRTLQVHLNDVVADCPFLFASPSFSLASCLPLVFVSSFILYPMENSSISSDSEADAPRGDQVRRPPSTTEHEASSSDLMDSVASSVNMVNCANGDEENVSADRMILAAEEKELMAHYDCVIKAEEQKELVASGKSEAASQMSHKLTSDVVTTTMESSKLPEFSSLETAPGKSEAASQIFRKLTSDAVTTPTKTGTVVTSNAKCDAHLNILPFEEKEFAEQNTGFCFDNHGTEFGSPCESLSGVQLIKRDTTVPKVLNQQGLPCVTMDELEHAFVDNFRCHEGSSVDPKHWVGFSVGVESASCRYWRFVAEGHSLTVDLLLSALRSWIKNKIDFHNFNITQSKGVLKCVELDASLAVGAELIQLSQYGSGDGLFIKTIDEASQFAVAVGDGTKYSAIVQSVNGQLCRTTKRFKIIKLAQSKKGEKIRLFLKCLLAEDAKLLWSDVNELEAENLPSVSSDQDTASPCDHGDGKQQNQERVVLEEVEREESEQATPLENAELATAVQLDGGKTAVIPHEAPAEGPGLAKPQSNGQASYHHFQNKYSEIVVQEFKHAKIHKHFAISRMWNQHKNRFSATCSEECPCVHDLPYLTETVVADQIEKDGSKGGNSSADDYVVVGLAGNFACKFMPKLKIEHPGESSSKLLGRLLGMWKLHSKNRNFGRLCRDECECLEGWDTLFRKGALPGEEPDSAPTSDCASVSVPKKRKSPVDVASDIGDKKKMFIERLHPGYDMSVAKPPDRLVPESNNGTARPRAIARSVAAHATDGSLQHPADPANLATHVRDSTLSERKSYSIDFDCNFPLGFYCVTEKILGSFCKIISVFPHGKDKVDHRLQAQTTILSTELPSGGKRAIKNHRDLKASYDEARQMGMILHVTFINTYVTEDSVSRSSRFMGKEWTSDGLWCGKCRTGWDGGASVALNSSSLGKVGGNVSQALIKVTSSGAESENCRVSCSVGEKLHQKGVRFEASAQCRTYLVTSLPCEFLEEGIQRFVDERAQRLDRLAAELAAARGD